MDMNYTIAMVLITVALGTASYYLLSAWIPSLNEYLKEINTKVNDINYTMYTKPIGPTQTYPYRLDSEVIE